jgi:type I restriction enzyme M protein
MTEPDLLFDRIPRARQFEDKLWTAADNLRANAKLKASEYAAPLLGLFFLRYASNRFNAVTPQAAQEFAAGFAVFICQSRRVTKRCWN